jgi:juvenile hormone epoxide hydrolase
MGKIVNISLALFFVSVAYFYHEISKNILLPELDVHEYWGKRENLNLSKDESVRKFKINFPEDKIEKLRRRLEDAGPFAKPLEGVAFQYGFNSNKLQEILKYWKDEYLPKWSERQKHLNQFPQFKTKIQGLDIHFIHVKPKVDEDVKVFPILLLHGWPTSANDFYKMIPMFIKPKNGIAFEVVAPNLPGFAFSESAARPGLAPDKMAIIMRNLMLRLKLEKFYLHSGDWVRYDKIFLILVFESGSPLFKNF